MTDPRHHAPEHEPDERLCDWVDGRMSPRELGRFEAELRVNPRLRAAADAYRRSVLATQAALRAEQPRVALADRILAAVRAEAAAAPLAAPSVRPWSWQRLRLLPLLGSLAAAALFVVAALLLRDFGSPAATAQPVAELPRDRDAAGANLETLAARRPQELQPQELLLRGGVEPRTERATEPTAGAVSAGGADEAPTATAAPKPGAAMPGAAMPGAAGPARPADSDPSATGSGAPAPVVAARFAEAEEQAPPGRPVPDAGAGVQGELFVGSRARGADGSRSETKGEETADKHLLPLAGASMPAEVAPKAKAAPVEAPLAEVAPVFPVLWFAPPSGAAEDRRDLPAINAGPRPGERGFGEGGAGGGGGRDRGAVTLDQFLAAQFSSSGAVLRQQRLALLPTSGERAVVMRVDPQAAMRLDSALYFATATPEAVTTLTPMALREPGGSWPQAFGSVPATDNLWMLEGPREQVAAVLGQLGQQAASNGIEFGNAEIPVPALTAAVDAGQPAGEPMERSKAATTTRRGGRGDLLPAPPQPVPPQPVPPQAVEPTKADADPKSARMRVVLVFGVVPAAGVEATPGAPATGTAPGGGKTDQQPPR